MATDSLPASNGSERAVRLRRNRVEKVQREKDVISLAAQGGYSDQEIADLLTETYAQQGRAPIARRTVTRYREEAMEKYKPTPQQVEQIRSQQLARLDELTAAVMPKAMEGKAAAVESVLKIERLRKDIVGTGAPKRVEVGGRIDHVHDIADPEEVERLEEAFKTGYAIEGEAFELPDELPALEAGGLE